MTHTRTFVLLLSALAIAQNSAAMELPLIVATNAPEKLDPKLPEVGRFGREIPVELPADRETIISSRIDTEFFNPQFNYAIWAQEAKALWPHMIRPVAHSTDGYSQDNLIELIDNIRATAKRNNCFNVRFIYDALEQMDLKVRKGARKAKSRG